MGIKSCNLFMGFLTLIFNIGYNGCSVGSNIWLAKWSSNEDNENMDLTMLVPSIHNTDTVYGGISIILCANVTD